MKRIPILTWVWVILSFGWSGLVWAQTAANLSKQEAESSCVTCHRDLEEKRLSAPVSQSAADIHMMRGLGCQDCHGGDPKDPEISSMDKEKGFVGVPAHQEIPAFCARCHGNADIMRRYNPNIATDQYIKYLISQHGQLNAQGDARVAVCTSCHGTHGIRPSKDPLSPVYPVNEPAMCAKCHSDAEIMKGYNIPTNQFEEYSASVHGKMLLEKKDRSAPACHNCHGSHDARRPEASEIGNTCAQCHSLTRDLFVKSPHKKAHDEMKIPECEICHGNHLIQKTSDEMLGTAKGAVCIQCHEAQSAGFQAAQQMKETIESLKAGMDRAQTLVQEAEEKGMDVGEGVYDLTEAKNALTQARTAIHSFSPQQVTEITSKGAELSKKALAVGEHAMGEFEFRRKGFYVSVGIILVVALLLYLKIRQMEKRGKK